MNFRKYLIGTIFAILLLWGPLDHSWPGALVIRIGYLVLIPLIVWLILGWVWKYWKPNYKIEDILERILLGIICIALFTFAMLQAFSKTHVGNTKWMRTRDGMEAVGDDIILPGPDWEVVIIVVAIAAFILWGGVIKKEDKASENKPR